MASTGLCQSQKLEMPSIAPTWWQEHNYFSHPLLLSPSSTSTGSWSQEPKSGIEPNTPMWDAGVLTTHLFYRAFNKQKTKSLRIYDILYLPKPITARA